MEDIKTYFKVFTVEKMERRIAYKLFGHTIFRSGVKRRGLYDMFTILEKYTGVKTKFKKIGLQHGWAPQNYFAKEELEEKVLFYLHWNKRRKNIWDKNSNIPSYVVTAPFVIYRRMNNITQSKDAKGTIAYPSHSVLTLKAEYNIDEYCRLLKELPEEFQPVTISLHHIDIEIFHMDVEYEKRGFKTICSSFHQGDKTFYEGFYDILKNYKYATSNEPGTYAFYAIEMGIPFFVLGNPSVRENSTILEDEYGKIAYDLFSKKPFGVITKEQLDFVNSEIGVTDCLTKEELRNILKQAQK